jgi:hypothetical protein
MLNCLPLFRIGSELRHRKKLSPILCEPKAKGNDKLNYVEEKLFISWEFLE